MKRHIQGLLMLGLAFFSSFSLVYLWSEVASEPVLAAVIEEEPDDSCANSMLGLRPWYKGLATREGGDCRIGTIGTVNGDTNIALNLVFDAALMSSMVATGFIIWGGYKYIMSEGEPGKVMEGKRIITGAVIGLILTISASVISDTLVKVIGGVAK